MSELRDIVRKAESHLRKGGVLSPEGRQKLRQAKQHLLEQDFGQGAVAASVCRASKAHRTLYRPGTQADAEDGWFVTCDDHGSCLSTETRSQGQSALADPDWCEDCQRSNLTEK